MIKIPENVYSLKEIKDYLTVFKQIFNEIDKRNQKLSVNIAHPRLNPRIAEDLCYQKHKKIFPNSIECKKVSSTHPDLQVNMPNGALNVEVKSTTADFQDIGADIGCDVLLWVNFKNYVKSDDKIKIYILDNTDQKLEQYVEEKKEDYARPTRMTLSEFMEISTRDLILYIDEEKGVVTENESKSKKLIKEKEETEKEKSKEIHTDERESYDIRTNKEEIEKVVDKYLPSHWKDGDKKRKHILDVINKFLKSRSRKPVKKREITARKKTAKEYGVSPSTISDKYTRQLYPKETSSKVKKFRLALEKIEKDIK